jgi:SAM-dependent methyltransferase
MRPKFYFDDLAYIHHAGFTNFVSRAAPALLAELRAARSKSRLLIDLGCGSGIWLSRAAQAGYKTIGVDISPAMLRLSNRNSPSSSLVCSSLYDFRFPPCGAVTAIGEVLCYFADGKSRPLSLAPVFKRVASALEPGGKFIFDLITVGRPLMNTRSWRAGEDWAVLTETSEKGPVIIRNIVSFRKVARAYRRSIEVHKAAVYPVAQIKKLLRQAGFSVVSSPFYRNFRLPDRHTAFFATKSN